MNNYIQNGIYVGRFKLPIVNYSLMLFYAACYIRSVLSENKECIKKKINTNFRLPFAATAI